MSEDLKKCSKCKTDCLETNFYKSKNMNYGLHPHCMSCKKQYYNENRDRLINKQKFYDKQNRDEINIGNSI